MSRSKRGGGSMFSRQFNGSIEKLVMESVFELKKNPNLYHGLYLQLFYLMEKRCQSSDDKNEAWKRFQELVQIYNKTCETSPETMRERHRMEKPSEFLSKALNSSVDERSGVRHDVNYSVLKDTFSVILNDLKKNKKNLDGTDFYSLFHILQLFSYTDFNPILEYFWKKFHADEKSSKKKKVPVNSTVASFEEAYDLVKGKEKRCFLCNDFNRRKIFQLKHLKQHMSSYHSIYSYKCDWNGCSQTFPSWKYVNTHKQRSHYPKDQEKEERGEEDKEDKENEGESGKKKRKIGTVQTCASLAKRTRTSATTVAAKQILIQNNSGSDEGTYSTASSSASDQSESVKTLKLDPALLHPMCEKTIEELCGIVESYDPSVTVTAPITYDANTGILERKVLMKPKVYANPVLSSPEQFIPGLTSVQQEVEI